MAVADTAITVTQVVGSLARYGKQAAPVARFIASFIPGLAPVVAAVDMAAPWLEKIAAAAPAVEQALDKGRPIFDAIEKTAPDVLPALKNVYAIAGNHDPARPETDLKAADVTDAQVAGFTGAVLFGRAWTQEETQRWFDKAQGDTPA